MRYKIYTEKTHPGNPLVKAVLKKGYQNVVVIWQDAISRDRGWTVKGDGQSLIIRGYGRFETLAKVNALPKKKPI